MLNLQDLYHELKNVSDVLVFGVSSLIILCSACIFLAGVIVLKRFELSNFYCKRSSTSASNLLFICTLILQEIEAN